MLLLAPAVPPSIAGLLADALATLQPPGLASAYLFGSHARGQPHRESDVDLGLLLARDRFPNPASRFDERVRLTALLMATLGQNAVDVVVLNDAPPGLGRRIVTEGRRVYCADVASDHAFVRDIQLRAADLEPFLRRMRSLKLEALARP
jgi:predicted nucleotidyltransferase